MVAVTEGGNKSRKVGSFLKEKIFMNTSLAFGLFLGLFAEKYLIGTGGGREGIILYLIRQAFS